MQKVYTDGSCLRNPGPGGWAFALVDTDTLCSGGEYKTTNNRMELQAVIEALLFLPNQDLDIYTDSLLVLNCAQGLWKRKANLDLWSEFDRLSKNRTLTWNWVRGHNGDKYNELVDKMARKKALYYQSLYL